MRLQPRWWIGVAAFLAYAAWLMAVWTFLGIDYAALGTQENLLRAIILPLGVAAIALTVFNWWSGWWKQTTHEPRLRAPLFLAILALPIVGFVSLNLYATGWATLGVEHTLILAVAMLLVGFCEEMVTRGVLLVSLRGSLKSEAWAWFWSSTLFGLLHATNAFFGLGSAALVQVVLAFCAGTGLYLVRRLTGYIWVAMVAHALWDFSSLARGQAPASESMAALYFLAGIYAASLVLVFLVLRQGSSRKP